MKLIVILSLLAVALSFNIAGSEIAFRSLQKGILKEEQCLLNPVQCPYSGGFSLPQCFTHPASSITQWDVCVSQENALVGGSFTFHVNYPSTILKVIEVSNTNCAQPVLNDNSLSVHCECSGKCSINAMWHIWF